MALKFNMKCPAPSKIRTYLNYEATRISVHKARGREQWQDIHLFAALTLNERVNVQHVIFNSEYVKNLRIFTTLETTMCPSLRHLLDISKLEYITFYSPYCRGREMGISESKASFKQVFRDGRVMNLLSPIKGSRYMEI